MPLIELSQRGTDERSVLECISDHIGVRDARADVDQSKFAFDLPAASDETAAQAGASEAD
jgi:hypothetical protein